MPSNLPPGPRFHLIDVLDIVARQLSGRPQRISTLDDVMDLLKDYDGMLYYNVGGQHFYVIWRPDYVHEAIVAHAASFGKGFSVRRAFGRVMGNGLFTSDGEVWRRQRKLLQPAFHHRRIETYAQSMVDHTLRMLDRWETRRSSTLEIDREMMRLTLNVVAQTLFSADVSDESDAIGQAMASLGEIFFRQANSLFTLPQWIPTRDNLRQKRAIETMDQVIFNIINERRDEPGDHGDLLSMLLMARYDDGSAMHDQQLRDEVMTLFTAGHETTALALTWMWYLLAQHPEVEAALHDELDSVLGGRAPTLTDLPRLTYTEKIVKEALRLCPPVPVIPRQVMDEVQIGGYTMLKGATALFVPYAAHRDPHSFEQPDRFWPGRWTDDMEKRLHRYAYFPFGGGPRICVGSSFAMMEARLVLAAVAQRCRLSLLPGQRIEPSSFLSMRPRYGMRMEMEPREMWEPELAI